MSGWSTSTRAGRRARGAGSCSAGRRRAAGRPRWRGGPASSVVGVVVEDQRALADPEEVPTVGVGQVRLREDVVRRAAGHDPARRAAGGGRRRPRRRGRGWTRPRRGPAARSAAMASRMCWRDTRSSPVIGSSSRSTSASWARPWATKARWRCPPDSSRSGRSARSVMATRLHGARRRPPGRRRARRRSSPGGGVAAHRHGLAHGDGQVLVGVGGLEHVGDAAPALAGAGRRAGPDRGSSSPATALQHGRLAGAVRPDQRGDGRRRGSSKVAASSTTRVP